jgi:P2-related tail formation protein
MEYDELVATVQTLRNEVEELKRTIENSQFLQEDYGKNQVFRRDVIFENPVYDNTGAKVIN